MLQAVSLSKESFEAAIENSMGLYSLTERLSRLSQRSYQCFGGFANIVWTQVCMPQDSEDCACFVWVMPRMLKQTSRASIMQIWLLLLWASAPLVILEMLLLPRILAQHTHLNSVQFLSLLAVSSRISEGGMIHAMFPAPSG